MQSASDKHHNEVVDLKKEIETVNQTLTEGKETYDKLVADLRNQVEEKEKIIR